jgi:DNA polymerase-3 subunit gamma/tau
LEEPPAHVIFVLATTDPQKIPITILSRCQRFALRRITIADIVSRLKFICDAEKIKLDPGNEGEILEYIAKQVDGGMRDAIKILQKCTSIDEIITVGTVVDSLGSVNAEFIETMVNYVLNQDIKNALAYFNNLVMEGIDIKIFLSDMVDYLKDTMITDVSNSNFNIGARMEMMEELLDLTYTLRNATQVKTITELRLMKICKNSLQTIVVDSIPETPAAPKEKQEKVYQVPLREDPNKDMDKALAELAAIVARYGVRFEALEMGLDQLKFKR